MLSAEVAELAYALVSEASGATLESSNLSFRIQSFFSVRSTQLPARLNRPVSIKVKSKT